MTDALDGFTEHRKRTDPSTAPHPAVRWSANDNSGSIGILEVAYKALDEPEGVKCFWKDAKLAIVPTERGADNAYAVNGRQFSCGWLPRKIGFTPDDGWYEAGVDDGILIVDFEQEPFRTP